jgi:putative Mg2+ transporter-C (MgtC) family protein
MNHIDPLSQSFWQLVGSALLCGTIIGFERQLRGKPAGIRTGCLVTLGTATFISLAESQGTSSEDVARVLGQVVTGVGFLGAGVMISQEGVVKGVTTGAVIWILAAIGSAIGLGYQRGAIVLSLVTVTILVGIEKLESSVLWITRRGAGGGGDRDGDGNGGQEEDGRRPRRAPGGGADGR